MSAAVENDPSNPSGTGAPVSSSGKSSNTGAIVGGVIGGIGGLLLIGLGAFFFRRRARSRPMEAPMAVEQPKVDDEIHLTKGAELNSVPDDPNHGHGESWELDTGVPHRFELPASEDKKSMARQGGGGKRG